VVWLGLLHTVQDCAMVNNGDFQPPFLFLLDIAEYRYLLRMLCLSMENWERELSVDK
jgi:hypothetical protein